MEFTFFDILWIHRTSADELIISANGVAQFGNKEKKRSKAGHLGEMTEVFSLLDEVLKDYRFTSEVTELSRHLKDQWTLYCFLYDEIMSYLPLDSERANERDLFSGKTRAYERWNILIEEFLTRAEL